MDREKRLPEQHGELSAEITAELKGVAVQGGKQYQRVTHKKTQHLLGFYLFIETLADFMFDSAAIANNNSLRFYQLSLKMAPEFSHLESI